jgi:predicted PurR-regulated permease PerM
VLTISAQLLLGVLFGFVGLLVASPLTATAMILVKMLYIEDVLGDRVMSESAGQEEGARMRAAASPVMHRS